MAATSESMADEIVCSKSGKVTLLAQSSGALALRGVKNKMSVVFDVVTDEVEKGTVERKPLDLTMVLDVSGSMSSENKLESCQQAIEHVLEKLSKNDVVSLIAYDSNVHVAFVHKKATPESLPELRKCVRSLRPGSMTNMWCGLKQAIEAAEVTSEKFQKVMFVFSDGQVNEGEFRSQSELCGVVSSKIVEQCNAKLYSFGVGKHFNEELMKGLAEVGLGSYYYIASAEGTRVLVDNAVGSILSPVAYDAVLRVRGAGCGVVSKIFAHSDLVKGAVLGDLQGGNTRIVIAEVEVTPSGDAASAAIVKYELEFTDAASKQRVKLEDSVTVGFSDDAAAVENSRNKKVHAKTLIAQTSENDRLVVEALERNDVASARTYQQQTISALQDAQTSDSSNALAAPMYADAVRQLSNLDREGASSNMKKTFHARNYMKRRNSARHCEAQMM